MNKRSVHDVAVITLVTIAVFMLFTAGCFLDSENYEVSLAIVCICKFVIIWFILANKDILNRSIR